MLDINFIRDNIEIVKKGIKDKGYSVDVDKLLDIDEKRRELLSDVENLRAQKNQAADKRDNEEGKRIKQQLQDLEPQLTKKEEELKHYLSQIPNLPGKDVPVGKGEEDNKVLREVGEKPEFNFTPKDHLEIGESLDIIDFERGAAVAGSGFYYLKNEGAMLEISLIHYALDFLREKGFIPVITPDLSRDKFYTATGYLPKGPEAQIYQIADTDLGLIATSEITIAGYHAGQTLDTKELPKKYAGYSHCFRMEAGSYGKYSKGLYRVHQFSKVEMFAFTLPEDSEKAHLEFLNLEEEFYKSLGISFRVLEMCSGDLGSQASRKFDLEAWMPGRGDFGEVTSTSNTTDYQSQNLGIKFKGSEGSGFVHTLNGTLCATSRVPIAILENFQQEDGSVKIPQVLQKYTGFSEIAPKNT
jgi:seryl-tRNA synthetase